MQHTFRKSVCGRAKALLLLFSYFSLLCNLDSWHLGPVFWFSLNTMIKAFCLRETNTWINPETLPVLNNSFHCYIALLSLHVVNGRCRDDKYPSFLLADWLNFSWGLLAFCLKKKKFFWDVFLSEHKLGETPTMFWSCWASQVVLLAFLMFS